MPRMRAWPCGLRTNAASSMSGNRRSATNRPRPVNNGRSSMRPIALPIYLSSLTRLCRSIDLDFGVHDDFFGFCHLFANVACEPIRGSADRFEAELVQALL